jgi:hypothetical protein
MKKIIIFIIFLIASIPLGIYWWKQSQQRSQLEHELRKAVNNNDFVTAYKLIDQGVSVNAGNPKSGRTVIMQAIDDGNLDFLHYIFEKNPGMTGTTYLGTALDYAISRIGQPSSRKIIKYLVDLKIPTKESPLVIALSTGQTDRAETLFNETDLTKLSDSQLEHLQRIASASGYGSIQRKIDYERYERKKKTND